MSFVEAENAIHLRGQAFVVGCYQGCAAFAPDQREEFAKDGVGRRFVQIACGFIGEDERLSIAGRRRNSAAPWPMRILNSAPC